LGVDGRSFALRLSYDVGCGDRGVVDGWEGGLVPIGIPCILCLLWFWSIAKRWAGWELIEGMRPERIKSEVEPLFCSRTDAPKISVLFLQLLHLVNELVARRMLGFRVIVR
jgi:hypothetical protein